MITDDGMVFVGPEEGNMFNNPIGGRMIIKARGEDTGHGYSLHDNVIPAGSPGTRPHVHHQHEEAFYVLEGELTLRAGTRTIAAPAGSFVLVPRGVVHQPSNPGREPVRVLIIFSPAGMERFFERVAEQRISLQAVPLGQATPGYIDELGREFDTEFVDFPVGS